MTARLADPGALARHREALAAVRSPERSVIAVATVRFVDTKNKIDTQRDVVYAAPIDGRLNAPDWSKINSPLCPPVLP